MMTRKLGFHLCLKDAWDMSEVPEKYVFYLKKTQVEARVTGTLDMLRHL